MFCPWLDVHTAPDDLEAYLKDDPTLSPWRLRIMGEMWAGIAAAYQKQMREKTHLLFYLSASTAFPWIHLYSVLR